MDIPLFIANVNYVLSVPTTFMFIGTAIILTFKTRFIQLRAFSRFIYLISGKDNLKETHNKDEKTITPTRALFTAMATTIGMGNVVGPSLAIMAGGPGALFWLIVYMIAGSAIKFVEVVYAIDSREYTKDGFILGGPMQYLKRVSPALAYWYSLITVVLFAGWCSLQANALSDILEKQSYSIPPYITGLFLALILILVLFGGAKRVGSIASKLVPIMFIMYVSFSIFVLFQDWILLKNAIKLVLQHAFMPSAALGGFMGATVLDSMRYGTYRGVYITEAGVGTASIPHSLTSAKKAVDQGILALYSVSAEIFLCLLSGLIILVTDVWTSIAPGCWSNTLIYDAFKVYAPSFGSYVLLISISLFVITTVIGNAFNGSQSFASITNHKGLRLYYYFVALVTFLGAIVGVKLAWDIMDIFLALAAIPNLVGLLILSWKLPKVIKF